MLPAGNQKQVLIHETDCTYVDDFGHTVRGEGAFVDQKVAVVYVGIKYPKIEGLPESITMLAHMPTKYANDPCRVIVKDWHGMPLGEGFITALWRQTNYREKYKMASVSFQIEGLWYKGRFAPDHGDLCRGTRLRTKKVIEELTARLQSN